MPVIDSHQHVWDPSRAAYDWLGPEQAPIDRAMSFDDLAPELAACGVDATVLVQSADHSEDTALMRQAAAAQPRIVGIVGYAPLADAEATATVLAEWAADPLLVGVRNLIHDLPDPDWLLRPDVDAGLGVLEEHGVPFDVVAVLPRHLELVPILSERHPRLKMVIDHLAKPPIGLDSDEPWTTLIARAAENPLVYAKVSGLYPSHPGFGRLEHRVRPAVLRSRRRAVRRRPVDVRRGLADLGPLRRLSPGLAGARAAVRLALAERARAGAGPDRRGVLRARPGSAGRRRHQPLRRRQPRV